MAITFVGAGAEAYGTGNLSVGVPSGIQEGDLLIVVTTAKSGWYMAPAMPPSGWTTIAKQDTISVAYHHSFYKWAGASESAVTVTEYNSAYNYAMMFAYRGVDTTTPVLGIGGGYYNQPSNSISVLSGTTTATDNAVVVWAGGWWWNSGTNTANNVAGSTSGLTNFAEVWDYHRKGNAANSEGLFYYHGWKETAGATGSNTLTWANNLAQGNWAVWYLKAYANVTHALTIYYKYLDGSTAAATYSSQVSEGSGYSIASPSVTGYTPDESLVTGTMSTSDVTVTVTYTLNACVLSLTPDLTKIGGSGVSSVSVSSNINAKAFEARATLDGQGYGRGVGINIISDDLTVDGSGVHTFAVPTTSWSFDVAYSEINTDGTYRISVYAQNADNVWSA